MSNRSRARFWLTIVVLALVTGSAWAEVCKGSKVKQADLAQYDQEVNLSQAEVDTALETHLPFGQPACPRLLPQREYILCYDPDQRLTLWAGYLLRAEDLVKATRLDAFRTDPRLTDTESAHCADYAGSSYDRGHVVPRDDMNRTPAVQANTFFLSNMTPQTPNLNQGMWRWLEELVRTYVSTYSRVYIISGSIFTTDRTVPSGQIAVPSHFYKVLIRQPDNGDPLLLALVLPNQGVQLPLPPGTPIQGPRITAAQADAYLKRRLVSVTRIEHLTGLVVLPGLTREELKKAVASELWPRN